MDGIQRCCNDFDGWEPHYFNACAGRRGLNTFVFKISILFVSCSLNLAYQLIKTVTNLHYIDVKPLHCISVRCHRNLLVSFSEIGSVHSSFLFKGVVRSFFILDILKVLIPESTLYFTRTKTEQICLRYPQKGECSLG